MLWNGNKIKNFPTKIWGAKHKNSKIPSLKFPVKPLTLKQKIKQKTSLTPCCCPPAPPKNDAKPPGAGDVLEENHEDCFCVYCGGGSIGAVFVEAVEVFVKFCCSSLCRSVCGLELFEELELFPSSSLVIISSLPVVGCSVCLLATCCCCWCLILLDFSTKLGDSANIKKIF